MMCKTEEEYSKLVPCDERMKIARKQFLEKMLSSGYSEEEIKAASKDMNKHFGTDEGTVLYELLGAIDYDLPLAYRHNLQLSAKTAFYERAILRNRLKKTEANV